MRKVTKFFAAALACMMAFALQAPVNAAQAGETKAVVQSVNDQSSAKASVQGDVSYKISYLTTSSVGISFNNPDGYRILVKLYNYKKKQIAQMYCYSYASFSVKKNQVYYYRASAYQYQAETGQYVQVTNWSAYKGFNTVKCSLSLKSGRRVKIKTPKVKGVKRFTLYMSTKSDSGYRKIKTVKAGNSIIISKYKGKKFVKYKNYYYKVVPNKGKVSLGYYFWVY